MSEEAVVSACVLIIGNEILSGRTQDSNLAHIAQQLGSRGIHVTEARVIPDHKRAIIAAVREASRHFDYVFTTGGIGPTHDDITAECIAKAFDRPLVVDPSIAALIQRRPAPTDVMDARMRMARIPQGARLIDNPTGGPQGFFIENVYVMAGIPRVMQAMLGAVLDTLRGGPVVKSRSVTAYLGESRIAGPLAAVQARYPEIDLGSYPFARDGRYGTTLVLRGTDEELLAQTLTAVEEIITAAGATPEAPVH